MPSKAESKEVTIKQATCPSCGCGRYYSKDGKNKIRPLVANRLEFKLSSIIITDEFQCDEVTANSVKLNDALWTVDEHANKVLCRLDKSGGESVDVVEVLSNTEDTLVLKYNQKIKPFTKDSILDPKNKSFYAFREDKEPTYKLAIDKYYDKNILVCECGDEYIVD